MRKTRITREEVRRIGYTAGCPGCRAVRLGQPAQNHTEKCRDKMEKEIMKANRSKLHSANESPLR